MRLLRRLIIGLAIGVGIPFAILLYGWFAAGPAAKATEFTVAEGSSVSSVATDLQDAGLINSASRFKVGARLFGGGDPVQAGEFEIPKGASASAILDLLQHGRPVQRLITITEGMPAIIVQERLAANAFLTGPTPEIAEGSVLPDSYSFERGEARAKVVERMQAAMRGALAEEWKKRSARSVAKSPEEAIILASIVEKETGKASERPMVAGVLSNRIRIGMALGADATTIYPVTKGKPLGRMIRRSELAADNGYNTRLRRGLPVGPITNPGRESIAAVLNPAETDALYYVADGSGGHVFARTLAEHNANVARWRQFRKEKGI
jgi:UPF0755 protein